MRASQTAASPEFVEFYYLLMTSPAGEVAYFANRPRNIPYKARTGRTANNLVHDGTVTCGNNPFMYARKVSDLVVSHPHDDWTVETLKWKEPPTFQWDCKGSEIILPQDGERKELTRRVRFPINDISS